MQAIKKNKNFIKELVSLSVRFVKKVCSRLAWGIACLLPIKKNKITVSSYYGGGYGDNPKYIVEQLLKTEKCLKIVWLVKSMEEAKSLPEHVEPCRINTIKSIYHLATAKFWIDNCRKNFHHKRKKQIYIQTWHGFALKRIEKDVQEQLSKGYMRKAVRDSKHIDLLISDSQFMTQIYKNSFWYNGDIVEWGSPRNDLFYGDHENFALKIKQFYNIEKDKKIVLYAPTFRADYSLDAYQLDGRRVCALCQKRFGSDFVLLIRLHPNIVDKCTSIEYHENEIINATFYPDMQELLAGVDIVISDYSSLMFDFALSKKPCFQFATDIEAYKKDRNFYFKIDNLPFPLCKNNDDLEQAILTFDMENYQKSLELFFKEVGMVMDGQASVRCAQWILEKIS